MAFDRLSKADARSAMKELTGEYRRQAADLEAANSPYTETEVRAQFIDRFLGILGWDVANLSGLPQPEREVVLERTGTTDGVLSGRPDYRLRIGGHDRMPVEAKKPSVRLSTNADAALQARSYGWSLSLPASALSNFAETIIFDTTVTPEEGDGPNVATIPGCRFSYDEYVTRFDDLWDRLSYEVLSTPKFNDVYSYIQPPRGTSPFDTTFLAQFRRWRLTLSKDIAQRNPQLGAAEIGRRTQRLLNALLFLRVCEDRNIGQYQSLLNAAENSTVIESFRDADRIFNARLFDVLDSTALTSSVLLKVVREMYWPRTRFAFGVLQPEILAALYEQYLAERVEVSESRSVTLAPKPELTHAGGVVPTPQFIVDWLLHSTLGAHLAAHEKPSASLSVLDPACGSGVFLVAALNRLMSAAERNGSSLTLAERGRLAKDHLYGVDIDGEAVEVTKLSILLAVLGDEIIDTQRREKVLPELSGNIRSANFLISDDFDQILPTAAAIPERRAAVSPASLNVLFKGVLDNGGFSIIVGNPPYTRIQTLSEFMPDQLAYFQDSRAGFKSAAAYNFDTYMLFVEKALPLLAASGKLAFILPNRFTNTLAAAPIRSLLGPRLIELVHFGEEQVFPGRSTYTALITAGPPTKDPARFEIVRDLSSWREGTPGEQGIVTRNALNEDPWQIASGAQAAVFVKMEAARLVALKDWVHIFVGIQTSADRIYFVHIDENRSTEQLAHFVDPSGNEWQIERSILRPALQDQTIEPYGFRLKPDAHVIFPYVIQEVESKKGVLRKVARRLSLNEMQEQYPKALSYFRAKEEQLKPPARSVEPPPGEAFWSYGRSQSLTRLSELKIVVRVLSLTPRYAIDPDGLVPCGGGDGGPYYLLRPYDSCPYSPEVVVALLSHPAVDAYVASRGKAYRGSYISHRKAFLEAVPVPELSPEAQINIKTMYVEYAGLSERLANETDSAIRATLVDRQAALRFAIESVITAAYGLTDDQVASVNG